MNACDIFNIHILTGFVFQEKYDNIKVEIPNLETLGHIILKYTSIYEKYEIRDWTGSIWLIIGIICGL
jgi:hypothetical protein